MNKPTFFAVLCAALLSGCSSVRVSLDYDREMDFSVLKTYAWQHADQPATGNSRIDNDLIDDRVRKAVGSAAAQLTCNDVIGDLVATAESMEHPYADLDRLRRLAFTRTLKRFGAEDAKLAEELAAVYLGRRFENLKPRDGAREALLALKETYTLCTVSNGEQDLETLGLADLFSFVVLARDVGYDKPDPRIFREAMKRASCRPEELVHVGDSLRMDVAGAQAAGAWAIWYNPRGQEGCDNVRPDAEVKTLAELPRVIRTLA